MLITFPIVKKMANLNGAPVTTPIIEAKLIAWIHQPTKERERTKEHHQTSHWSITLVCKSLTQGSANTESCQPLGQRKTRKHTVLLVRASAHRSYKWKDVHFITQMVVGIYLLNQSSIWFVGGCRSINQKELKSCSIWLLPACMAAYPSTITPILSRQTSEAATRIIKVLSFLSTA